MAFGGLRGTFTGGGTSITASNVATGSVAVSVGDLIVVGPAEAAASVTASAITDNLGGTYTSVIGRFWYGRVTTAGTLTSVTVTATASSNDWAVAVAVFEGPFAVGPLDVSPTGLNDTASPFVGPATGTLAQADELVVCVLNLMRGQSDLVATAPNLLAINRLSSTDNAVASCSVAIGYQVVNSTASVTPQFTITTGTITAGPIGTYSFKKEIVAGAGDGVATAQATAAATGSVTTDFGYVRGTLAGSGLSTLATSTATGSVDVSVGDLVVVVTSEPVSYTASAVTDNLGNTYTLTNTFTAGARAWYKYISAVGTLTTINCTMTASANDYAIAAAVFQGPFNSTPLDQWSGWSNRTASPIVSTATPTLSQPDELIVGVVGINRGQTDTDGVAPLVLARNIASAADDASGSVSAAIGSYVVSSTAAVTVGFTATGTLTAAAVHASAYRKGISNASVGDANSIGTASATSRVDVARAGTAAAVTTGTVGTGRYDIARTGSASAAGLASATGLTTTDIYGNGTAASASIASAVGDSTAGADVTGTGTSTASGLANATGLADVARTVSATSTSIANATGRSDSPRNGTAASTSIANATGRSDVVQTATAGAASTASATGLTTTDIYGNGVSTSVGTANAVGGSTTVVYPLGLIARSSVSTGDVNTRTTPAIDTTGANLLIVHITNTFGTTSISLSDNKGNTWFFYVILSDTSASPNLQSRIYLVASQTPIVGPGHTFTFNGTGAKSTIQFSAWRSGIAWSDGPYATGQGALPHGTSAITTAVEGDLVLSFAGGDNTLASVSNGTVLDIVSPADSDHWATSYAYFIQPNSPNVTTSWSGTGDAAVTNFLVHGTWVDANASTGLATGTSVASGVAPSGNDTGVGTASAVSTATGVSPAVGVPDCILNWNLAAGTGADLTSNSNDGVFHGGITPTTDGPIGNAAIFNGTTGYISNDQIINISEASISLWLKTTNTTAAPRHICGFGEMGASSHEKDITLTASGTVGWYVWSGTGSLISGIKPVNDGRWHHIVCTISSSAQNIYVDGVLEATAAGPGGSYTGYTFPSPNLGGNDVIATLWLPATYDDFRVYDRAITAVEVASLHSEGVFYLVRFFTSAANRNDFTGYAGVKFTTDSTTEHRYNRIGVRCATSNTGLHTVSLYLWVGEGSPAGTPLRTVGVDLTGGTLGEFYYAEIPEITLNPGVEYALVSQVTNAGQFWSDDGPVALRGVAGTTRSSYFDSTQHTYRDDRMYVGVDLALVEEVGGVADTGVGVATAIAVGFATGRSDILRIGSVTTTSIANATSRIDIARAGSATATSVANAQGIGGTGLATTRYVDPDTFGTAVVSRGVVTLTTARYVDPDTFRAPSIGRGAVTLTNTRYVDADTFGTAVVGRGSVSLTSTRYVDLDTFGIASVGRGVVTLTQARYLDPDTFRTPNIGRGPVTLISTRYADPDTFGTATITTGVGSLAAVRYIDPDTFGTAVVGRGPVGLTTTRYLDPDTFGTTARIGRNITTTRYADPDLFGTTTRIGFRLLQARYVDPDIFGTTASIGRSVTTTRYVDADTFRNPSVGRGAVTLTSTRYISPDDFGTHVIQQQGGPRYLGHNLYIDADTFRTPNIGRGPVGLTTTRYADPDTYGAPVVIRGVRNLTATRYADPDVFRTANIIQGPGVQTLVPARFVNNNNFLAHQLRGQYTARPTRYVDADTYYPYLVAALNRLVPIRLIDPDQFYQIQLKRFVDPDLFVNQGTFHATEVILGQILLPSLWANTTTYGTPAITIRFAQHADPTLYEDPDYFYHTIVRIPPTAGISAIPGRYIVTNDPLREIVSTSSTTHRVIQSNRGVRTVTSL